MSVHGLSMQASMEVRQYNHGLCTLVSIIYSFGIWYSADKKNRRYSKQSLLMSGFQDMEKNDNKDVAIFRSYFENITIL